MTSRNRNSQPAGRPRRSWLDRFDADDWIWIALFVLVFLWLNASAVQSFIMHWHEDQLLTQCREQAMASHYPAADIAALCKLPKRDSGIDLSVLTSSPA
jgi:hypothetical protein